ncbi:dienelactone hydrolase family protein [Diplodia corticola]|uniref:Dienelactone hydrolase family protein n=1 Tax=Diplodia corticola TaxID=236234 RepID=A0A1J9SC22_9PEZI|nr:dienelactone hydrolase family protein [Diplodia corticola]OJD37133.1 dienelactone hydrolase family protein [Diplodia corticola]
MADQDVATRAPESDAQEDSPQPTMTEHCASDRPTPAGETPTGEITKLNGVDVYIAKPSDYPHSPSKLLLLLTGGTGINSTNNQLQADKYAREGFLVVMPDQFEGDPAPNATMPANEQPSFIEQLKLGFAQTTKTFMLDMWLARHTPEKVLPTLHKVIEGAKEEFADAIANGGGIYGVGYCFGARYILILAGKHSDTVSWGQESKPEDVESGVVEKGPEIKVGAIAHPTAMTKEELAAITVPVSLALVDNDPVFPDELATAGKEALEKNGVEHEIKTYSGVPHGFAVLGDYEDPKVTSEQQIAYGQMLGWLQAH